MDDVNIEIARLQEILSSVKEQINELRESQKILQSENVKRHEETRDSYYLAEMTRKRFEEQNDLLLTKLNDINTRLDQIKEDYKSDKEDNLQDRKAIKADVKDLQDKHDSKWLMIVKIVLLLLTGFITGSLAKVIPSLLGGL